MQYRSLGYSGVAVSTVGLGSWHPYGGSVEERTAVDCLQIAHAVGLCRAEGRAVPVSNQLERVDEILEPVAQR